MVPTGACCRLCLRTDNLISSFDKRLQNGYHLRMCIFLTAGVEIKMTDKISKTVCHQCCSVSVQIFQFRQIAMANDKALKELVNQEYVELPTDKDGIQSLTTKILEDISEVEHQEYVELPTDKDEIESLTTKILENISEVKLSDEVPKVYKVPISELKPVDNEDLVSKEELEEPSHGSIEEVFQYFPNISVPKQILEENVSPAIRLDANEIFNYRVSSSNDSDSRVAKFKRRHSRVDLASVSLDYGFSDSDSDLPVFKSKKKKSGYRYDDSGSDYDVTSDLGGRRRTSVRSRRSRHKIFDSDSDNAREQPSKKSSSKYSEYDSDETCDSRRERLRKTRTKIFEWDNEDVIEEITRKKSPSKCSDYDSDDTSEAKKERLRTQRTKTRVFDWDNESTTEQPIVKKSTEAYSKYCEYCDRYFWGCSQLKAHQRVHFRCHICRKGFESHEILDEHLVTVCYRSLACRKVNIALERVDQNVKLLGQFKEAFDTYFQDINDGVYGDPELLRNPSLKPHLFHTEKHRIEERKTIADIIKKHNHLDNTPITKNKLQQTRRVETDVACVNTNQVVLDDIKTDISLYNIPVILVVDRIQSAHISFAPKAKMKKVIDAWPTDNIKGLVKKAQRLEPIHIKQEVTENTPPTSLLEAVFKAPIGTRFDMSSKAKKIIPFTSKQLQPRPQGGAKAKPKTKQTPTRKPPVAKTNQNKNSPKSKPVQKPPNRQPGNVIKSLPNSLSLMNKINNTKPNIQEGVTMGKAIPDLPRIMNISDSVTLERNNQVKADTNYNQSMNNEINYPPRPSTAIRNILESISDEISIEPNYNRSKQQNPQPPAAPTGEFSILQSSFQCLDNQIKEELPSDPGYNDFNDTLTNYNEMDYKEEYIPAEYAVKTENENYEMYHQNPPDFTPTYPQIRYEAPQVVQNRPQVVQNRPQIPRNRFDMNLNGVQRPQGQNINPYQNHIGFRMQNPNLAMPSNIYQANQNPVQQSRALVPVNSFNNSNFMENVYERPCQERFNTGFNNVYQQNPYQNPYIPPYNTQQTHQNVQFNELYQESNPEKFVRVKQPWELYRR